MAPRHGEEACLDPLGTRQQGCPGTVASQKEIPPLGWEFARRVGQHVGEERTERQWWWEPLVPLDRAVGRDRHPMPALRSIRVKGDDQAYDVARVLAVASWLFRAFARRSGRTCATRLPRLRNELGKNTRSAMRYVAALAAVTIAMNAKGGN